MKENVYGFTAWLYSLYQTAKNSQLTKLLPLLLTE
jgi:hypothetical protein